MAEPRVVVVGSVNEDLVTKLPRLPAPGETVAGGSFSTNLGGKGANQALAAARLGAHVWMVGAVGDDGAGSRSVHALRRGGVDVTYVRTVDVATGTAQILVDDEGENMIAVSAGANAALDAAAVAEALVALVTNETVVLTNFEVPDAAVLAAAQAAATAGARLVLNPAPARSLIPSILVARPLLVPNGLEAGCLGWTSAGLLERGATLIVTQGEDGALLLRHGLPPVHQPSFRVTPVDATGAGDAFCAALACVLANGGSLERALYYAAGAGAFATLAMGAQSSLPTLVDLEAFMKRSPLGGSPASRWR